MDAASLHMAEPAVADRDTAQDLVKRLGVTTTPLYIYGSELHNRKREKALRQLRHRSILDPTRGQRAFSDFTLVILLVSRSC